MKKYRIEYQALFRPNSLEGFEYNGEKIDGLALYFEYRYYDAKTGNEVFWNKDEEPTRAYDCYIDNENGYKMVHLNNCIHNVTYKPSDCFLYLAHKSDPRLISFEEALSILKANYDKWDNGDNRPTQCTSYCSVEVR